MVLSRAEVGLLIDALLQAEATLCDVDSQLASASVTNWMRAQQLSLAERLEGMMCVSASDVMTFADDSLRLTCQPDPVICTVSAGTPYCNFRRQS